MEVLMKKSLTQKQLDLLTSFQKDELTSALLYKKIAKRVKDKNNQSILLRISTEEQAHAHIWQQYTKKELKPNFFKVLFFQLVSFFLGYTFVIKILETHEYKGIQALQEIKENFPEVEYIISQEETHETELINMLNEERLNYIGAMVLGLNDALVELTGCIAGLTFVLMNTKTISKDVLSFCKETGITIIDVPQGYAACSCLCINENAFITADKGIYNALVNAGASPLLIETGYIEIDTYDYGFIGGASGFVNDVLYFFGDITAHPDFEKIDEYLKLHKVKYKWFDTPLVDIGGVLEFKT
jgi:rubrerythrin